MPSASRAAIAIGGARRDEEKSRAKARAEPRCRRSGRKSGFTPQARKPCQAAGLDRQALFQPTGRKTLRNGSVE
jgi:3'-phosphoadenosine 5'-phosphosulfate sulfotransferase (PAPS reductase)/FAD synthetase